MEIIGGDNAAVISYNADSAKTNEMNLLVTEGTGSSNLKFSLEVNTAGKDSEENKVFGKGEYITYTINIANFNSEQLTGFKGPISGWNFTTAIPVVFQIPTGLRIANFVNADVAELSESPYITYTQDGVTTKMKRIIDSSKYENGTMYGYRILGNTCTMLLPKLDPMSDCYLTCVVEKNGEISLGTTLTATATIDFTENDNLDENQERIPIASNEVTVKYAYVDVTAEKNGPASVNYDKEFSYDIVITNSGNLPAEISKISDPLPEKFTVSTDADSAYKITVKRGETPLVKDSDYSCTVKSSTVEITPASENEKIELEGSATLTVTITGKVTKSTT